MKQIKVVSKCPLYSCVWCGNKQYEVYLEVRTKNHFAMVDGVWYKVKTTWKYELGKQAENQNITILPFTEAQLKAQKQMIAENTARAKRGGSPTYRSFRGELPEHLPHHGNYPPGSQEVREE